MQNYVSICEHQTRTNPALAAVHGQAALLLRYKVPPTTFRGNFRLQRSGRTSSYNLPEQLLGTLAARKYRAGNRELVRPLHVVVDLHVENFA